MELNCEQIEQSKDYIEDVLKNWALWQTHHSKLTQSMRDILVLIEVYEQKIKELTKENESLLARNFDLSEKGENVVIAYKKLSKENERLRGILLQFTDIVHKWGNKNEYDTSEISLVPILNEESAIKSQIKADTVKQFADGLEKPISVNINVSKGEKLAALVWCLELIKRIKNEMLEDVNEK